jgi:excisionase family DNA binding protein
MEPRYLSLREAASYLSLSKAALYLRIHRRTIPFIKDGGRVRFDRLALDRHMRERTIDGTREHASAGRGVVCEGPR